MNQPLLKEISVMPNLVPSYFESKRWSWIFNLAWSGFLLILVMGLLAAANFLTDGIFLSGRNLENLFGHNFLLMLVCLPLAGLLFSRGGVDVSVGASYGLFGLVFALVSSEGGPALGCVFAFSVCIGFGLLNASLVGFLRIPGILVTLLTAAAMRGLLLSATGGQTILVNFGESQVIPTVAWIFALLVFAGVVLIGLRKTQPKAGYLRRTWQLGWPYLAMAVCAGFMGLVSLDYIRSATMYAGTGDEIQIIAIMILSGTWFAGNKPNYIGLVLSLVFIIALKILFNILGATSGLFNITLVAVSIVLLGLQVGFHAIMGFLYKNDDTPTQTAQDQP